MRSAWLVPVLALVSACGGGSPAAASGSDQRKISRLEDELADARSAVENEKANRATAETALAESKAKCAAQVAAASATAAAQPAAVVAPPPVVTPPVAPVAEPPPPPKPVLARITEKNAVANGLRLILSAGRNRGIAVGWTGQVFEGKTTKPVARFKITAVRDNESEGVSKDATIATLGANDRVELTAPAP